MTLTYDGVSPLFSLKPICVAEKTSCGLMHAQIKARENMKENHILSAFLSVTIELRL